MVHPVASQAQCAPWQSGPSRPDVYVWRCHAGACPVARPYDASAARFRRKTPFFVFWWWKVRTDGVGEREPPPRQRRNPGGSTWSVASRRWFREPPPVRHCVGPTHPQSATTHRHRPGGEWLGSRASAASRFRGWHRLHRKFAPNCRRARVVLYRSKSEIFTDLEARTFNAYD